MTLLRKKSVIQTAIALVGYALLRQTGVFEPRRAADAVPENVMADITSSIVPPVEIESVFGGDCYRASLLNCPSTVFCSDNACPTPPEDADDPRSWVCATPFSFIQTTPAYSWCIPSFAMKGTFPIPKSGPTKCGTTTPCGAECAKAADGIFYCYPLSGFVPTDYNVPACAPDGIECRYANTWNALWEPIASINGIGFDPFL